MLNMEICSMAIYEKCSFLFFISDLLLVEFVLMQAVAMSQSLRIHVKWIGYLLVFVGLVAEPPQLNQT